MPIREFVCPKCGYKCEEFQQVIKTIPLCPKCQTAMDSVISKTGRPIIK